MHQRLRRWASRNFRHRWSRSFTGSADTLPCPVADCTASGEFHPALKTSYPVVCEHYTTGGQKMQAPILLAGTQFMDNLKNFVLPSMQTVKNILK